jgi:hypothetical protein
MPWLRKSITRRIDEKNVPTGLASDHRPVHRKKETKAAFKATIDPNTCFKVQCCTIVHLQRENGSN